MKVLSDYGVIGDGIADDTAAVQAALNDLVEGDVLEITPGRFKIDGNLMLRVSYVVLMGMGEFLKDPLSGVKPMFIMADFVDGVVWQYVRFDGSRSAFGDGNGVPCILGHRNSHTKFKDMVFRNSVDVGIKMRNAYDLEAAGNRFENIGESGGETRWYENDPRTGLPWIGPIPDRGSVNIHHNYFRGIGRLEDAHSGMVDGTAWTADNGQTSREVRGIAFRGNTVEDCLRGFYSENNAPYQPTRLVDVSHNQFIGRATSGPPYVKQGIGLINVEGFTTVGNIFDNWGNHDPYQSSCDAIVISGNSRKGTIALNAINDTRTTGDRMDIGIHLANASDVSVFGNVLNGGSEAKISFDPAHCSNLRIAANAGAERDFSWADTFEVEYYLEALAAGVTGAALKPSGWSADANTANTSQCALVGVSYRLTGAITAGTFSIGPYIGGSLVSAFSVSQADFTGQYAEKKSSIGAAPVAANLAGVAVRYTTNAAFAAGGSGVYVRMIFDRSRKA